MTDPIRVAAQALLDAVDARHDQPPPLKYTVPYGAVVALSAALSATQPAADERTDALRRALEIIAVGDSKNPQADAAEELIALGYWRDIPEARIPIQQPADERVAEHIMTVAKACAASCSVGIAAAMNQGQLGAAYVEESTALAAVESSARALLAAGRDDEWDKKDTARLDWLMPQIKGKELRRIGINTSAGGPIWTRVAIDAAIELEKQEKGTP